MHLIWGEIPGRQISLPTFSRSQSTIHSHLNQAGIDDDYSDDDNDDDFVEEVDIY